MPMKLLRPCNQPMCAELTNDSYCPEHKKAKAKQYDKARGTATERGYNSRWTQYSILFRKKNPLCVECLKSGTLNASEHTDHIVAVYGKDDPLFWLASNHQALCQGCHNRKTIEEGGFKS